METSTVAPIPVTNSSDRARESLKRRKRKKMQKQSDGNGMDQNNRNLLKSDLQITQWRSEAQQQVYGSKLWQALRQVRQGSGTGTSAASNKARRQRAVRETADRVLAVTAKGRTRWSRAILTNKLKLKFMMSNRKQRGLVATATGNSRLKKRRGPVLTLKKKSSPAVQKQARVLGGLVPGCRKQRLPVVLKEATSYIPALEMQVKAMAALFELLSGGSSSTSVTAAGNLRPPPCL
ncbi:hypothetical protein L1987_67810 [Smallanthus sonchifolius]|uniref:Uncharacterized protein n=1 Tax=Smallanthus sonchifolius TaxID=185202 RepID=A0ACB9B4N0_9ASTR|nr:hypothetical protein L1987_67810 [Smallanthus sonchifolius]